MSRYLIHPCMVGAPGFGIATYTADTKVFTGYMDEPFIHLGILTQAQIQSLYDAGV